MTLIEFAAASNHCTEAAAAAREALREVRVQPDCLLAYLLEAVRADSHSSDNTRY